jgi:hypothetical protein
MARSLLTLVGLLVALVLPGVVSAGEPLSARDRALIRGVIEAQLAAFQADDGATAFGFASPSIQRQFGNPANFLAMVRTGYRPVHRPREVQFRGLVEVEGEPVQLVLLVGPDFEVVTAYYVMQRQADGSWRINGCVLQAAPDQAT